ncbi:cytochrome P450 [Chiua virens]|nr:cytochrome P450 [Chiua virens]
MFDFHMLDLALQTKAFAALAALIVAGSIIYSQSKSRRRLPLPPGPPAHWLFGNAIPREDQSQQFAAWINQYGRVISLRIGPKTMIIIGRYKESVDIMDKQGGLLVGRPRTIAAGEMLSRGLRLVLAPAGEQFRRLRRAAHTHLQPKAAESYAPIQMNAARDVILDILDDPKHHQAHANRYAASVILRVAYGKSTPTATDAPEIIKIDEMLGRFQKLMRPGALLVEKFPVLKHVPFYASYIETWRKEESKLFHDQLDRVSRELKTGNAGPSFVRYLLENKSTHKLSHDEMAYLAGSLFGAGSDTTSVAIMVVVMAAACHPEAQDAVQNELDNVVASRKSSHHNRY